MGDASEVDGSGWINHRKRRSKEKGVPWSIKECKQLSRVVAESDQNAIDWTEVAKEMPGRTVKQCREKWKNDLRPDIKKGNWTPQEEYVMVLMHARFGNSWSDIAHYLPRRSENAIKNNWNATGRSASTSRRKSLLWIYGQLVAQNSQTTTSNSDILKEALSRYSNTPHVMKLEAFEVPEDYFQKEYAKLQLARGNKAYVVQKAPVVKRATRAPRAARAHNSSSSEGEDEGGEGSEASESEEAEGTPSDNAADDLDVVSADPHVDATALDDNDTTALQYAPLSGWTGDGGGTAGLYTAQSGQYENGAGQYGDAVGGAYGGEIVPGQYDEWSGVMTANGGLGAGGYGLNPPYGADIGQYAGVYQATGASRADGSSGGAFKSRSTSGRGWDGYGAGQTGKGPFRYAMNSHELPGGLTVNGGVLDVDGSCPPTNRAVPRNPFLATPQAWATHDAQGDMLLVPGPSTLWGGHAGHPNGSGQFGRRCRRWQPVPPAEMPLGGSVEAVFEEAATLADMPTPMYDCAAGVEGFGGGDGFCSPPSCPPAMPYSTPGPYSAGAWLAPAGLSRDPRVVLHKRRYPFPGAGSNSSGRFVGRGPPVRAPPPPPVPSFWTAWNTKRQKERVEALLAFTDSERGAIVDGLKQPALA